MVLEEDKKMHSQVCQECTILPQQKVLYQHPAGQVWDDLSMDFIKGLSRSLGVGTVLTKYTHLWGSSIHLQHTQ